MSYAFLIVTASVSVHVEGVAHRVVLLGRRSRPGLVQRLCARLVGQVARQGRSHALVLCAMCACWSAPAVSGLVLSVEAMAAAEELSSRVNSGWIRRSARRSDRASGHLGPSRDGVQTRIACRNCWLG